MSATDQDIVSALIEGVRKAVPDGGSERQVMTLISKPLWRLWCKALGDPEDTQPSEWLGTASHRVYGSHTVLTDSEDLRAVSFSMVE